MIIISSNHASVDSQTADAVAYLDASDSPELQHLAEQLTAEFPEFYGLTWNNLSSWVDTEASSVDIEYMDWVRDWIERNTPIRWYEGEPIIDEEGDEEDDI
jgi:predicted nucleotidyltransferase